MNREFIVSLLFTGVLALSSPAGAKSPGEPKAQNHPGPARSERPSGPDRSPHGPSVRPAPPPRNPHRRPVPAGGVSTTYRGHHVVQRPFDHRGRTVDRYWVRHTYGGRTYERYWPRYYDCAPRFWGAYFGGPTHWVSFHYVWPWIPSPWWVSYGYYYRPYVYYPSPVWFLTDYVFLYTLYGPYDSGYAGGYSDGYRDARVSEEEKAQIRSQIDDELNRNHAEGEAPATVTDNLHNPNYIYLVSSTVTAQLSRSSNSCTLSKGDLLKAAHVPAEGEDAALMKVLKAQDGSCPEKSEVFVPLEALQTFQNGFSQAIEDGLSVYENQVNKE